MIKKVVAINLCILLIIISQAHALEIKTVTIQDYLGVTWSNELVHYKMEFKQGELKGAAIAKVETNGKNIPSQSSDITRYENDGSVKSFNIWFQATIPADKSVNYKITPGKQPKSDKKLSVEQKNDYFILKNGLCGVKLLNLNKEYTWPADAKSIQGPILGLILPSGKITGKAYINAPFKVHSIKSEITSQGPLFAEVKIHYTFSNGYWIFKAKVLKDCPMLIIDEEFNTGISTKAAGEFDNFHTLILNDGAFKPSQTFFNGATVNKELHDIMKQGVDENWLKKGHLVPNWSTCKISGFNLTFSKNRTDFHLMGYPTMVQPQIDTFIRFVQPGKSAVGFAALETMKWRNPLAIRFQENTNGQLIVNFPIQRYIQDWSTDAFGGNSPNYTGKTLNVPPAVSRRNYGIMLSKAEDEKEKKLISLISLTAKLNSQPLDSVKDWTLKWPDPKENEKWADKTSEAGTKELEKIRDWIEFWQIYGNFGYTSMARHWGFSKRWYPSLQKIIDSQKDLTLQDRKELRKKCAFLAYIMNSPDTFPWGSGHHLNNPNMSIMAVEARAKSSLLVKDHPMFKKWGEWTADFLADCFSRYTKESGAPYENPHYVLSVTIPDAAKINNLLLENDLKDSFNSALFKKTMEFLPEWLTPPDPRFNGYRVVIPLGNSSYQSVPVNFGEEMISYYKDRNPEMASMIQWFTNQTLPEEKKVKIVEKEIAPKLKSKHFEDYGVAFHHGYGTEYETLFHMIAGDCDGHYEWESDQMSYTLYAKGQPINLHFGNGYFPMFCRPWLRNRVSIDHKYEMSERNKTDISATSFTSEVDYLRAYRDIDRIRPLNSDYPSLDEKGKWNAKEKENWLPNPEWEKIPMTTWYRQVMFLKDKDPKGPNYFVFRETFDGKTTKTTDLNFWFLANTMKKESNYYHFDGQCKVDMDVFVNTPQKAVPETDKYGHVAQPYRLLTGNDLKYFPEEKRREDQLLFRLKQPAGKGYMVVLYPRLKENDPAAKFTNLSENTVKVETAISTDYILMNSIPFEFENKDLSFKGTSAAIRFYKDKTVIVNTEGNAKITIAGKDYSFTGSQQKTITK